MLEAVEFSGMHFQLYVSNYEPIYICKFILIYFLYAKLHANTIATGTKARASNIEFLKEQYDGWTKEIHACLDNTPDVIIEQRDLYDRRPSGQSIVK